MGFEMFYGMYQSNISPQKRESQSHSISLNQKSPSLHPVSLSLSLSLAPLCSRQAVILPRPTPNIKPAPEPPCKVGRVPWQASPHERKP